MGRLGVGTMTPAQDYRNGVRAPQVGEDFRECEHLAARSEHSLIGRYTVDWFRSDAVGLVALCQTCSAQTLFGNDVTLSTEVKILTGYRPCAPN